MHSIVVNSYRHDHADLLRLIWMVEVVPSNNTGQGHRYCYCKPTQKCISIFTWQVECKQVLAVIREKLNRRRMLAAYAIHIKIMVNDVAIANNAERQKRQLNTSANCPQRRIWMLYERAGAVAWLLWCFFGQDRCKVSRYVHRHLHDIHLNHQTV